MPFTPKAEPQFGPAARNLIVSLEGLGSVADRAAALSRLNRDIGDGWFPVYLKLLVVIGEGAPESARCLVADSLAHAMQHGQTTGGSLSAWGIPMQMPAALATAGRGFLGMSSSRSLDPLSYLAVWFSQSTSRQPLAQPVFEQATAALLRLFAASVPATLVFQAKLRADLSSAPAGTFSAATSLRLRCLLEGWSAGVAVGPLVRAVARASPMPVTVRHTRLGPGPLA